MKQKLFSAIGILMTFILWTMAVCTLDVQAAGPQGSAIGFGSLNLAFHNLTGVHMALYSITDWLSLVPLGFILGFALLGLTQWIQRKSLLRVDPSILALGIFYLLTLAAFCFFETCVVNYRPILIDDTLEASYPSSTTLLVLCVIPTAKRQLRRRIQHPVRSKCTQGVLTVFMLFMVLARLLSGVHWLTDIVGGILLSTGLVLLYDCACSLKTPSL